MVYVYDCWIKFTRSQKEPILLSLPGLPERHDTITIQGKDYLVLRRQFLGQQIAIYVE